MKRNSWRQGGISASFLLVFTIAVIPDSDRNYREPAVLGPPIYEEEAESSQPSDTPSIQEDDENESRSD